MEDKISYLTTFMCPYHGVFENISNVNLWDKISRTSLHWAAFFSCMESIKYEIDEGSDVNSVDYSGNSTLHLACFGECTLESIRYLLSLSNININAQNNLLETPLNLYIRNYYWDYPLLLSFLQKGANPNIPDAKGNTVLHYLATSFNHRSEIFKKFTEVLLTFHANVNIQNREGNTPLHLAIVGETVGIIPIFLNNGASIFIKNEKNLTPIDLAYAKKNEYKEVFLEIGKHIIILTHCNVPIEKNIINEVRRTKALLTFDEQCKSEMLKLQNLKVGQTGITLGAILKWSTYTFAKYLRNPEILINFQNSISQSSIIFENRLDQRFKESLARKEAEEHALPFFVDMFKILSEVCVNHIMMYLGSEDLNNIK